MKKKQNQLQKMMKIKKLDNKTKNKKEKKKLKLRKKREERNKYKKKKILSELPSKIYYTILSKNTLILNFNRKRESQITKESSSKKNKL